MRDQENETNIPLKHLAVLLQSPNLMVPTHIYEG